MRVDEVGAFLPHEIVELRAQISDVSRSEGERKTERLVLQELQMQRADRLGLKASDEMVNNALTDIASSNSATARVFHKRFQPEAPSGIRSSAPRYTPQPMASNPHSSMMMLPARIRCSIQIASASKPTPNTALTAFIQLPARGASFPAEIPNRIKGTPIPRDIPR